MLLSPLSPLHRYAAKFKGLTGVKVEVEKSAKDQCKEDPSKEWVGSSCRDACTINCRCASSHFGCCPGTITDVARKNLDGTNCAKDCLACGSSNSGDSSSSAGSSAAAASTYECPRAARAG